jgi:hypothetical protein
MLPEDLQRAVVEAHPDLFEWHDAGFAALRVDEGELAVGSTVDAPFGYACDVTPDRFTPLSAWSFES